MIFGAIADDVTGGVELAGLLKRQGVDCGFVTDPGRIEPAREAVVVALKTRTTVVGEARAMFRSALSNIKGVGAARVFFKYCATFDSTAEGNIGPCADVLADELGADLTLFVPSFPEAERYVFQAHLFVQDRLLSDSAKRFDPLTPMTDANLIRVLQAQTANRVGHLPLQILAQGAEAAAVYLETLRMSGVRFVIADAISAGDLACIAEATADLPLMTGNSSVAEFFPAVWRRRGMLADRARNFSLAAVDGPAVVLAGSCADRTLEQLAVFGREHPVFWIDPLEAVERDIVPELVERVLPQLDKRPVAVASSASPEKVSAVQARLGVIEAGRLVEAVIGRLAAALRDAGVRRFLIAGGETSGAVLAALSLDSLDVGPYQSAGIGRVTSRGEDPIALCLKSGKLGSPDMFAKVLEDMRHGGT